MSEREPGESAVTGLLWLSAWIALVAGIYVSRPVLSLAMPHPRATLALCVLAASIRITRRILLRRGDPA